MYSTPGRDIDYRRGEESAPQGAVRMAHSPPPVSIFVDGDSVGVRRKNGAAARRSTSPVQSQSMSYAQRYYQAQRERSATPTRSVYYNGSDLQHKLLSPPHLSAMSIAASSESPFRSPRVVSKDLRSDTERQRDEVQQWLMASRHKEVTEHHGKKYATPREKLQQMVGGPPKPSPVPSTRFGHQTPTKKSALARFAQPTAASSWGMETELDDDETLLRQQREPLRFAFRRALESTPPNRSSYMLKGVSPRFGERIETLRATGTPGPGAYNIPSQFSR